MFLWLYDWESLTLGYHAANFGDFSHCNKVNETFSICLAISKELVFERLPDFIGGKSI